MAPLLEIKGLKTHFATDDGMLQAVDGVDIALNKGETLCVVGESGCGKTVTAMSILKLIPMPPGRIVDGQILFEGRDLVPLTSNELDDIRAKEIGFIFQARSRCSSWCRFPMPKAACMIIRTSSPAACASAS